MHTYKIALTIITQPGNKPTSALIRFQASRAGESGPYTITPLSSHGHGHTPSATLTYTLARALELEINQTNQ